MLDDYSDPNDAYDEYRERAMADFGEDDNEDAEGYTEADNEDAGLVFERDY